MNASTSTAMRLLNRITRWFRRNPRPRYNVRLTILEATPHPESNTTTVRWSLGARRNTEPAGCGTRNPRTGWVCDWDKGDGKHRTSTGDDDWYDWRV